MSAEGQSFVENHSPYSATTYSVHLRLGLLSNDAHDYAIFCGDRYLAEKCRCSERAVRRAKARLISDGYLRVISEATGHRVARYQFLFKVVGQVGHLEEVVGQNVQSSRTNATSSPIYRNEYKESDKPADISVAREHLTQIRRNLKGIGI